MRLSLDTSNDVYVMKRAEADKLRSGKDFGKLNIDHVRDLEVGYLVVIGYPVNYSTLTVQDVLIASLCYTKGQRAQ